MHQLGNVFWERGGQKSNQFVIIFAFTTLDVDSSTCSRRSRRIKTDREEADEWWEA